ncbi:hypothetical protein JCM9279_004875 [Rhodotorula babjevae]
MADDLTIKGHISRIDAALRDLPAAPWRSFNEIRDHHLGNPNLFSPSVLDTFRRAIMTIIGLTPRGQPVPGGPFSRERILQRYKWFIEESPGDHTETATRDSLVEGLSKLKAADTAAEEVAKAAAKAAAEAAVVAAARAREMEEFNLKLAQNERETARINKKLRRHVAHNNAELADLRNDFLSPERAIATAHSVRTSALLGSAPSSPSPLASTSGSRLEDAQLVNPHVVRQSDRPSRIEYKGTAAPPSTPSQGRPRRAVRLPAGDFHRQSLVPVAAAQGNREEDEDELKEVLDGHETESGPCTAGAAADHEGARRSLAGLYLGAESLEPVAGPSSSSSSSSKAGKTAVIKKGPPQKQAQQGASTRRSTRSKKADSVSGIVEPSALDLAGGNFPSSSTRSQRSSATPTGSMSSAPAAASAAPLARRRVVREVPLASKTVVSAKRRLFPAELAPDDAARVEAILKNRRYESSMPGAAAAHKDLKLLNSPLWLNDELVNFIGVLINKRSDDMDKLEQAGGSRGEGETRLRKAFVFNSNFYTWYGDSGFAKVKRWTRTFETFEKDIIIVPINHESHWSCAAVNLKLKRFEYYDSLRKPDPVVYERLRAWLVEEHRNREGSEVDLRDWTDYWNKDVPQQENVNDCGVFTCMFMESLARNIDFFDFTQKDMPYLRKKMVLQIDKLDLLDVEPWV